MSKVIMKTWFSKILDKILCHCQKILGLKEKHYQKFEQNITYSLLYYIILVPDIGIMVRVFANSPGDLGSIPGRVIPKTFKMVLDASLLNSQHYKVWIKGKVEKPRERSSAFPNTLV